MVTRDVTLDDRLFTKNKVSLLSFRLKKKNSVENSFIVGKKDETRRKFFLVKKWERKKSASSKNLKESFLEVISRWSPKSEQKIVEE